MTFSLILYAREGATPNTAISYGSSRVRASDNPECPSRSFPNNPKKDAGKVLRTSLDALAVGKKAHMPVAPVMIYGDDGTHVVTEEGIAYLYKAEGLEERFHARDGLPSLVPETWPPPAAATARRRAVTTIIPKATSLDE